MINKLMDGLQQQQASKQWELCSSVQQMQTGARQDSCWAAASPPTRAIIRWASSWTATWWVSVGPCAVAAGWPCGCPLGSAIFRELFQHFVFFLRGWMEMSLSEEKKQRFWELLASHPKNEQQKSREVAEARGPKAAEERHKTPPSLTYRPTRQSPRQHQSHEF